MKIDSNNIGNYGPSYIHNVGRKADAAGIEVKPSSEITSEEKKFFVNMYPQSKDEIVDYHFYKRSGQMAGVSLGSIFDKKG